MKIKYDYTQLDGKLVCKCPRCGVFIDPFDEQLHTEFHEHLSKIKDFMDQHQYKI